MKTFAAMQKISAAMQLNTLTETAVKENKFL